MNKSIVNARRDEAPLTKPGATTTTQDRLGMAGAALDEVMAEAHEAGDWYTLRVLHSLTALLAATRH
ncbi:hypothetical protein [Neoroseomonas lacus]|uniref:Uncharacterized protein n=1 Tax=Neoroseomonas lacus TaxID=287609 RepID=A0A917KQ90_9PROT|nr:hypothetical protein [Neoroseomonas lacus]GGJ22380.1 hypothetical protein GCM10011320_32050 [Neoroseomonas lacus]